ncbi:MAG: CrcB family protein [Alicyclobacillus sp.]|nr:CrcB family protein [Alicyclobacillus sp.]
MTLANDLLVGTGATVGTVLRYGVGQWLGKKLAVQFPWGTWLVNVVGAFWLGWCVRGVDAGVLSSGWWMFLGTGVCGGFTTFSTLSVETVRLLRVNWRMALVYVGSSLGVGGWLGWLAMHHFG